MYQRLALSCFGAGALTVIGMLLPFATAGPFRVAGTAADDGKVFLVCGLLAIVVTLINPFRRAKPRLGFSGLVVLGGMIGGGAMYHIAALEVRLADGTALLQPVPGSGLYVAAIAGVVLVCASALGAFTPPPIPEDDW